MVDVSYPGSPPSQSNDTSVEETQLRQLTDTDTSVPASSSGDRDKKQSTPRERGEGRRRGSRRKSPDRQGRRWSRNRQGKEDKVRDRSRDRVNNYNYSPDDLRYRSHQADSSVNVMRVTNDVTNTSRVTSPPKMATDCKQLMCHFGGKCVKDELR